MVFFVFFCVVCFIFFWVSLCLVRFDLFLGVCAGSHLVKSVLLFFGMTQILVRVCWRSRRCSIICCSQDLCWSLNPRRFRAN
ncbi:hypothetical protein Hanom_Chr04g00303701 [Helianthus anomalus]